MSAAKEKVSPPADQSQIVDSSSFAEMSSSACMHVTHVRWVAARISHGEVVFHLRTEPETRPRITRWPRQRRRERERRHGAKT